MTLRSIVRNIIGVAALGAAWSYGAPAHAGEGGEKDEKGAEKDWHFGLDLVFGFGKVHEESLDTSIPAVDASSSTQSFIASGGYELSNGLGLGLRVPFALGSFDVGKDSHSSSALGNIELEGDYHLELTSLIGLKLSLGIALPTAQSAGDSDSAIINGLAAESRGMEENALFVNKAFGIIPKAELDLSLAGIELQPYAKLENLVSTNGDAADGYIMELVFGGRASYRMLGIVDAGLRAWVNLGLIGSHEAATLAVEPEVRVHLGPITPMAGFIIPITGPASDPRVFGLRLAAMVEF